MNHKLRIQRTAKIRLKFKIATELLCHWMLAKVQSLKKYIYHDTESKSGESLKPEIETIWEI
jgi:hypothetical protein